MAPHPHGTLTPRTAHLPLWVGRFAKRAAYNRNQTIVVSVSVVARTESEARRYLSEKAQRLYGDSIIRRVSLNRAE